jgi:hypothetical protein
LQSVDHVALVFVARLVADYRFLFVQHVGSHFLSFPGMIFAMTMDKGKAVDLYFGPVDRLAADSQSLM